MKKNTILSRAMTAASAPEEAWVMGDRYFAAAEKESYKHLSKETLSLLLHSAITLQKENGMLYLYEDPAMPQDARVDIIHKPSYAIAAVAIYAHLHCPEIFDDVLTDFFRKLLEGAFRHGIIGHGIDHPQRQCAGQVG